jgi:NAD(P)H-hydrate epimerase
VPNIGLVPCPISGELQWTLPDDFADFPPRRPVMGHKGTFGHLGIIAGSLGYHGAAVLSALGAQRAQPGLITLMVPEAVYVPVASQLRSTMVTPWEARRGDPSIFDAILFGPGLANPQLPGGLKETLVNLWRDFPETIVADASALAWLEPGPTRQGAKRVITPHPGEAARLLGEIVAEVQADRPAAVRELSNRYGGCQVVLKGHQTLAGDAHGPLSVNCSGNPHLAQGGSGDILAGWLAGLLAQSPLAKDFERCIRYAVWRHGLAADQLVRRMTNWNMDDLLAALGGAIPDA